MFVAFQISVRYVLIQSKMSKIEKRPHPDDDKEDPKQIIASASEDNSCLRPKKKFRLLRKLFVEENDRRSWRAGQSSKAVDVNENVFHEKGQESLRQSLTRTSLFILFESKPRPIYPWTPDQTDILKSAVESKSFHFLPNTTTEKIFKDLKKIFHNEKFNKRDVFLWFLRQKETAQVSFYIGNLGGKKSDWFLY